MRRIRRMRPEDLLQVVSIEQAVFPDPWSLSAFESGIAEKNDIYLVCEWDGRIAGYCGMWGVAGEGQITNVAVADEFRRRGVGKEMLSHLLEQGRAAGLTAFTLEVRVSNTPAIHLYRELGFVPAGIRKNFYSKPTEDAIIMWLIEDMQDGGRYIQAEL